MPKHILILAAVALVCIAFSLGALFGHPATVTLTCKPVSISYQAPDLPPIIQTVCEAH